MPKEIAQALEVDQPFCTKTWGSSTDAGFCGAHLAASVSPQKCQHTRKTCSVPLNYATDTALLLPGSSGNYASTPDSAANSIVGDLDVLVRVAANDWTPGAEATLFAKWVTTTQKSWRLNVTTGGNLKLYWSADGSAELSATSSVATGFGDGTTMWVRATLDVDNGAAGRDVKFYYSQDYDPLSGNQGAWTQLGTTQTSGGVTSIFNSTSPLEIGSVVNGTADFLAGKAYAAELRNGIAGAAVALFHVKDALVQGATTVTSSKTGEVWTINGSGSPKAFLVVGTRVLRFATKQGGVQRTLNAIAAIRKVTTNPGTLNLAGMDGRSELILGQRENVALTLDDGVSADVGVDPYRLERISGAAIRKSLVLPGESGDYASTPDSAANSIVGDLTVNVIVAPNDWTPGAISCLVAKWGAAGQRSYKLEILTDGKLRLSWSADGTTVIAKDSTVVVPGVVDGATLTISALLDVDNGAAGNTVSFFSAPDFNPGNSTGTFTQVGTNVVTGGTTSIFNSTATLTVGAEADGSTGVWAGKVLYASVIAALNALGAPAAKFDPQQVVDRATSFAAPGTGETWTINQSGTPKAELVASPAPYDPYASGTHWGKWLARNPYHVGYPARLLTGEVGQTASQMGRGYYLVKGIDGPTKGSVAVTLRDLFDRIAARKAVCPKASRGELFADITGSPGSFQLFPSGVGAEYASAGYVCIGDEIIQYTRSGDVFTVVARGALGTTQQDHKDEDHVQQVALFSSMTAKNIVYSLFIDYAGVPLSWIDQTAWAAASSGITELYTGRIARPVPVGQLIGELEEQAGFSVYPNVVTGMIDFSALRASAPAATIDDVNWIVKGSFETTRLDMRRVSQCWVHYGQKDPTLDLDRPENYNSTIVFPDLASEGADQYGSPSIKTIFSRWIPQFGRTVAVNAATRIVGLFRDPPLQAEFRIPASKSAPLGLATPVTLRHPDIQDEFGQRRDTTHAIVRMMRDSKNDEVALRTLELKFGTVLTDKTIFIENDVFNVDFRVEWEKLWGTPVSGDTAKCVVMGGVRVGSTSPGAPAFDQGTWPAGVVVQLVIDGSLKGAGGAGGAGGSAHAETPTFANNGTPGGTGGTALKLRSAITIDNTNGHILGGGGGGGGGGGHTCRRTDEVGNNSYVVGGSGGGAGQGDLPNSGGAAGSGVVDSSGNAKNGNPGGASSTTAAGGGGAAATPPPTITTGAAGGNGGTTGSAGASGSTPTTDATCDLGETIGSGGAAGAAGNAVEGNSFATWTATGDRLGSIV